MPKIDFESALAGTPLDPEQQLPADDQPEAVSYSDYATDIPKGLVNGVVGAGQSIGSLLETPLEWVGADLVDDSIWDTSPFKTKTWVGGLTTGITQVAATFAVPGVGAVSKLGAVSRLTGSAGRVAKFADRALVPGAVADFLAFKGNDGGLANVVEEYLPSLSNPVTRWLADRGDDDSIQGRLKNLTEGLVIGPVYDGVLASIKYARASTRGADTTEAAAEVAEAAAMVEVQRSPIRKQMSDVLSARFGKEYADSVVPLFDANARVWAESTGKSPDDYFNEKVAGIKSAESANDLIADIAGETTLLQSAGPATSQPPEELLLSFNPTERELLAKAPYDTLAEIHRVKTKFRGKAFKGDEGWEPLEFSGFDKKTGKPTYKVLRYSYAINPETGKLYEGPEREMAVKRATNRMLREVQSDMAELNAGQSARSDQVKQAIQYAEFYSKGGEGFRRFFGPAVDLIGDLFGTTSPNTPVKLNFSRTMALAERFSRGDYDEVIKSYKAWRDKVDAGEIFAQKRDPVTGKATGISTYDGPLPHTREVVKVTDSKTFIQKMKKVFEKHDIESGVAAQRLLKANPDAKTIDDLINLPPGATFNVDTLPGTSYLQVTEAMYQLWRKLGEGDVPKARTYSALSVGINTGNAVIDVWAARTLQRIMGRQRLPSVAEGGVDGAVTKTGSIGGHYGFANDAMKDLAKKIDKNEGWVQAYLWFREKHRWAEHGWTGHFGTADQGDLISLIADRNANASRHILGLTTQTKAFVPDDASLMKSVDGIAATLKAATADVHFVHVQPTTGHYGGGAERALNMEFTAANSWDRATLVRQLAEFGKTHGQDDVMLARITREGEVGDNIRPGVEVHFRAPLEQDKADELARFLSNYDASFTLLKDARGLGTNGIRMIHIAEYDEAFQTALKAGDAEGMAAATAAAENRFTKAIQALKSSYSDVVSSVDSHGYEVTLFGKNGVPYEEALNQSHGVDGQGIRGGGSDLGGGATAGGKQEDVLSQGESSVRGSNAAGPRRRTLFHLSRGDRRPTGVTLDKAGTAHAGQERSRLAASPVSHYYTGAAPAEAEVTYGTSHLHTVVGEFNTLELTSPEAAKLIDETAKETGLTEGPEFRAAVLNKAKAAGYDSVESAEYPGYFQSMRDVQPAEVQEATALTPQLRESLLKGKFDVRAAAQSDRGAIRFLDDGRAMIYLFKNADASTAVHEAWHLFRRTLREIDSPTADAVEKHMGVTDGVWTREQEESWARMGEKYLADGQAPEGSGLGGVFSKFKTWIKAVYAGVMGSPLGETIDPAVRDAFDRMLGRKTTQMIDDPLMPGMTEQLIARVRDSVAKGQATGLAPDESLEEAIGLHVNFKRLDASTDVKDLLALFEKFTQPLIDNDIGGVLTLKETKALAEEWGEDAVLLHTALTKDAQAVKGIAPRLVAARMLRNAVAEKVNTSFTAYKMNPADTAASDAFSQNLRLALSVDAAVGVVQKELARGVGSGRVVAAGIKDNPERIIARIKAALNGADPNMPAEKLVQAFEAVGTDSGGLSTVMKWFDNQGSSGARKLMDMHNELWMASLLSGVRTQVVNFSSNILMTMVQPTERLLGGVVTADSASMKSALRLYHGIAMHAVDLFRSSDLQKAVLTAAKSEMPVLDPTSMKHEVAGAIPGMVGKFVRLPFRIMGTTDEFFKQINYRSAVRDQAFRAAETAGITHPKQLAQYVEQYVKDSFTASGAAAKGLDEEFLRGNAMQYAREASFTQDLLRGTLGRSLQEAVNKHPGLRLVMPFVRTPTNLFRKAVRYTPGISLLMRETRDKLTHADPMVRAQARGEMMVGGLFWGLASSMAMSGRLTGGGPSNKEERDLLLATGWRPYSVVRDNPDGSKEYVEFRRFDPFASILGLAADFAEIGGQLDDEDVAALAVPMTAALARNLTNKTYLTGLAEVANLLTAPDRYGERWLSNRASSYVPNVLSVANDDEYLRDVRSIMDGLKKKLPGLSETLPPRRNILGEAITPAPGWIPFVGGVDNAARQLSPAAYSRRVGDSVKEELAALRFGFSQPSRTYRGVPLDALKNDKDQNLYDRYVQLHGEVSVGGKSLHDALSHLFSSDRYKRLPAPEGENDQLNPRIREAQHVIGRYRDRALRQLRRENPDVDTLRKEVERRARSGRTSGRLEILQSL